MIAKRMPDETNDSVHLIVSLLVRHPELSRVRLTGRSSAIALFFVVRGRVDADEQERFRSAVIEHLGALHDLADSARHRLHVRVTSDDAMTFVEVERDAKTIVRDELALIVALATQTFGERLIVNPPADDAGDDEPGPHEDAVGPALDAVRRIKKGKALVGLREERRVLVYFDR